MPVSLAPVVWIVDDDPDDQYLLELAFTSLNPPVAVKLLNDGEELLPALIQSTYMPSLIVLDLNMPRLNGFEALKLLRAEPDYQHLPVVVLTTSTHANDQEKALQLGANGFVNKPASTGKLLMLFGELVQQWPIS